MRHARLVIVAIVFIIPIALSAQAWTFSPIVDYPYPKHNGTQSGGLAVFDCNGDGVLDLVLAGQQGSARKALVYLGSKGAGDYALAQAGDGGLPALDAGALVEAADFDGDGAKELVLAGHTGVDPSAALFQVWKSDGDGTFTLMADLGPLLPREDRDAGEGAESWPTDDAKVLGFDNHLGFSDGALELVDADRDGDIDIVYSGRKGMESRPANFGFPVTVRDWETGGVFLNSGGHFAPAKEGAFSTEYGAFGVLKANRSASASGDFDGDGFVDLVVSGQKNSGANPNNTDADPEPDLYPAESQRDPVPVTEVLLSRGGAGFRSAQSLTGLMDGAIACADIDGDGDLDLVLSGNVGTMEAKTGGRRLEVWKNDGHGTFSRDTANADLIPLMSGDVALGDLDGDDDPDLVAAGNDNTRSFRIYENVKGIFVPKTLTKAANGIQTNAPNGIAPLYAMQNCDVLLVDLDADGDLDIVLDGQAGVSALVVWRNCLK